MKRLILAGLALVSQDAVLAAVPPSEADQLGTTLTLFGAERGASADGRIPAYDGGLTKPVQGYTPGSGKYVDPFADEKPLHSITAANMAEHDAVLTEGSKALLKKYDTFRIDVYPTHRTIAYPQAALDAMKGCAINAKLTDDVGSGITGAFNCVPFPIPKNGMEVMWNHKTRPLGKYLSVINSESYNVGTNGRAVLSSALDQYFHNVFWDPDAKSLFDRDNFFSMFRVDYKMPTRRAGEMLLLKDPANDLTIGRKAWSYLPGQRRVRMAPDVGHDTPNPTSAGMTTYDDNQLGSLDRFDWKLVGKREMLIPYNNYRAIFWTPKEKMLTTHHANPDALRWELHRVWVVEATLKPGKRHVYSKRRYYVDEDSWSVSAAESYDSRGELWRVPLLMTIQSYDKETPFSGWSSMYHDLNASTWSMYFLLSSDASKVLYRDSHPAGYFTQEEMAGSGVR